MKNHADAMIFHTAICEKNFSSLERSKIALMARRRWWNAPEWRIFMREPNLEEVLECLADIGEECQSVEKDTDLLDYILKRKNFDRDLWQILYYCQEERVNTFEKGICDIKDKQHRKKIVDSIIMLYPVTKNVINRMK